MSMKYWGDPDLNDEPQLFGRDAVAVDRGLVDIVESDDFFRFPAGYPKGIGDDQGVGLQFFFELGFQRCHGSGIEIANDYFSTFKWNFLKVAPLNIEVGRAP